MTYFPLPAAPRQTTHGETQMTPSTSLPALPQPAAQPVPTLADALVAISQWDLTPQPRKNLRSAVSGLAMGIEVVLTLLPPAGARATTPDQPVPPPARAGPLAPSW